jgi:nitroreductase
MKLAETLDISADVEYRKDMAQPTNDIWEVLSTARSIRRFSDEPVDDETLNRCLEAATWAPNGANAQLWRFVILDAPQQRAAVAEAARSALQMIESIYGMTRPDPDDHSRVARNNRATYELHDRAGELTSVLFVAFKNDFASELLQAGSIYPAMQNFYLAARAQGLGACFTSWASYGGEKTIRETVGVPDDWFLAGHVVVGWPRGQHGPVRRRPVSDVVFRNTWDTARADIVYGEGARPKR